MTGLPRPRSRTEGAAGTLLPEERLAGPMPWVIAVMTGLAALALAGGLALGAAAGGMGEGLARHLTVQVVTADAGERDAQAARALAAARADPAVAGARPVGRAEMAALLAPWLGAHGGDDLPLPAMIDVTLAPGTDAASLAAAVARVAPAARIDRHDAALAPLAGLIATLRLLAGALLLLMAAATAAVVVLAARGALDTHAETVGVLHLLGARDGQVARLFARRLARDALFGAAVGTVVGGMVVIGLGRGVAALDSGLGALAAPGWRIAAALVLLPPATALMAMAAARATVLADLARM